MKPIPLDALRALYGEPAPTADELELERQIQQAHDELLGCLADGRVRSAQRAQERMRELIKRRSPEQIARMERGMAERTPALANDNLAECLGRLLLTRNAEVARARECLREAVSDIDAAIAQLDGLALSADDRVRRLEFLVAKRARFASALGLLGKDEPGA